MPPRHLLAASTCAALSLLSLSASAEGAFDDGWVAPADTLAYGDAFNGTFTDLSARYGFTTIAQNDYSGYAIDLGARMSFPMLLGDVRLAYRYDALTSDAGARAPQAPELSPLQSHHAGASLALHPLYLVLLGADWLSYTIASLYLDLGLGVQYATRDADDHLKRSDLGFTYHFGVGIDSPLWNPDVGYALWLNVLYRNQRADFDLDDSREIGLSAHTLFVGLSWRWNSLLW